MGSSVQRNCSIDLRSLPLATDLLLCVAGNWLCLEAIKELVDFSSIRGSTEVIV